MKQISLRAFMDEDIPLFQKWLNKEYVKTWYLEPEDWLIEIKGRHDTYGWLHHFIVVSEEVNVGFCQYYDCYDAKELEDWYQVDISGKTFSIDYMIGNEEYLGKGYGKAIINMLTEKIKNEETGNEIIVQPDKKNIPSNSALKACGYIFDTRKDYYYKMIG